LLALPLAASPPFNLVHFPDSSLSSLSPEVTNRKKIGDPKESRTGTL
jgi:hypothetical protein